VRSPVESEFGGLRSNRCRRPASMPKGACALGDRQCQGTLPQGACGRSARSRGNRTPMHASTVSCPRLAASELGARPNSGEGRKDRSGQSQWPSTAAAGPVDLRKGLRAFSFRARKLLRGESHDELVGQCLGADFPGGANLDDPQIGALGKALQPPAARCSGMEVGQYGRRFRCGAVKAPYGPVRGSRWCQRCLLHRSSLTGGA